MSKKITLATCTFKPFWDVFLSLNSKAWDKTKVTVEKDVDGNGFLHIIFYNEAGDPEQNVLRLLSEQATAAGLALGFTLVVWRSGVPPCPQEGRRSLVTPMEAMEAPPGASYRTFVRSSFMAQEGGPRSRQPDGIEG